MHIPLRIGFVYEGVVVVDFGGLQDTAKGEHFAALSLHLLLNYQEGYQLVVLREKLQRPN